MPTAELGTYRPPEIERLRALSRLLDNAFSIPGTRFRFGWDGLIGLVPGVGDAVGAILSTYIILQASRLGAPKSVITTMIVNVAIDTVVGWIPVLGDLFDFGWKSNTKNLALLEQHLQRPTVARVTARRALLGLAAALVVFTVAVTALSVLIAEAIAHLLLSMVGAW
jgi:Domain of unknown function (DUF4112)